MRILFITTLFFIFYNVSALNNVCRTYKDYHTIKNNSNCWYNIAADANATEIIKYYKYPLEIHKVTTKDGYILTLFRIPKAAPNKGSVFFHPGVLTSAGSYLALGEKSLAFLLWNAGYDVWLGNYRGSEYSEEHVNLTVYDKKYWDYSLDEMAMYDVPAAIDHITQETNGDKVVYVAYSMGCAIGMIYASELPQHAKENIKLFILLGPGVSFNNIISPIQISEPFIEYALNILNKLATVRLASQSCVQKQLVKLFCLESAEMMEYCAHGANFVLGDPGQTDPEMLPVLVNQVMAGVAFKVFNHLGSFIQGPFRKYNYNSKNLQRYGTISPPLYKVGQINVPMYTVYAVNDWLCTKRDVLKFFNNLPAIARRFGIHEVSVPNFNHGDFIVGRNVKSLVYDRILDMLASIN